MGDAPRAVPIFGKRFYRQHRLPSAAPGRSSCAGGLGNASTAGLGVTTSCHVQLERHRTLGDGPCGRGRSIPVASSPPKQFSCQVMVPGGPRSCRERGKAGKEAGALWGTDQTDQTGLWGSVPRAPPLPGSGAGPAASRRAGRQGAAPALPLTTTEAGTLVAAPGVVAMMGRGIGGCGGAAAKGFGALSCCTG